MKTFVRSLFKISCTVFLYLSSDLVVLAQHSNPITLAQPGYYRVQIGDVEVIALSDGTVPLDLHKVLTNTQPGEIDQLLKHNYEANPIEASVNAYLIKLNGKLILVDAGTAELYGPTLGHLSESIKRSGYTPEQIDAILVTHIHTDHTGGLMEGNKMVFPNATLYISQPEVDFWLGEESKAKAPERLQKWFHEAEVKVGPYLKAGKVKTFGYGAELFPGITPIASPGHTPGHTFYVLESKGQKLVFWGDIMHAAAIQFANPSVTIAFDVDPKKAALQRKRAYDEAARQGYLVAVAHISYPGIGHVRAEGSRFVWIPITYSTLGTGQ
ncbi:MBL fold metallo-hydrolase [Cytophagaceae bacterium YF14B1]|uniref:MBL fold metallo-hydrolase n=1 Tax=Xanthocytophaga flava TaxID=3048013 RepID=A0AAE3UE32_9BACT|nr:MBL fold metallo-hydrolase [Xanthocytophaga flavus]MDJ1486394.1 MBL fold metallo-hydrolase [Xanthocytophaga flavus]